MPNPDYPANPALEVLDYATAEWSPLSDALLHRPTLLVATHTTLLLGTQRGLYRSPDGRRGGARRTSDGTIYATVNLDPRLFRLQAGGTRWEPLSCLPSSDICGVWEDELDMIVGTGGMPVLVMTTYDGLFVSHDGGATWDRMKAAGPPAVDFSYPLPLLSADFAENGVA